MRSRLEKFRVYGIILYFIIVAVVLTARLIGFDYKFSIENFNLIHIFIETFLCITWVTIFVLVYYSYPYKKNLKYLISAALFLCGAIINICHIYMILEVTQYNLLLSNTSNIVFCFAIFLPVVIPSRAVSVKRFLVITLPVALTSIFLVYEYLNSGFNAVKGHTYPAEHLVGVTQSIVYGIIIALNILALLFTLKIYLNKKSSVHLYLMNGIQLFNLAILFFISYRYINDAYSILGHAAKLGAAILIANAYFISNVKTPYEEMNKVLKSEENSNKVKTDFIVNLSHELRTPINVILMALRIMESQNADMKYVRSIEKNAYRLKKICETILDFNQIENGPMSINNCDTDAVYMIDEILEEAEEIIVEKELDVTFNFTNSDIILMDKQKLETILLQLISNSIKYAFKGGRVCIILEIEKKLKLNIYNDGPEIPDEEREKIFGKFYKAPKDCVECTEGLGVGLYISRKYAEFLGGTLRVRCDKQNTGYELILPVQKSDDTRCLTIDTFGVKGFFSDIN